MLQFANKAALSAPQFVAKLLEGVGGGSLSVAYAAPGDTNIDWSIDILDVANFLALGKFDTGEAATWLEGDFNYDGIVDILDAAEFSSTGLFNTGNYNMPRAMAGGLGSSQAELNHTRPGCVWQRLGSVSETNARITP